jgi:hypothetical protein
VTATQKYEDVNGTARAITSALLHGDTDTAARLASDYPDPFALAVAGTALAALVHARWANATGLDSGDRLTSWAALMEDFAVEDAAAKP